MICKNCGTDNITAEAVSCADCGQPLIAGNVEDRADQEFEFLDQEKDSDIAGNDDDRLDISDPIDFIMNNSNDHIETDTRNDKPESRESFDTEPIEKKANDFNLFEIETGMGSSLAPDSPVQPEPEKPERPEPTIPEYSGHAAVGVETAASELRKDHDTPATKKFKLDRNARDHAPSINVNRPSTDKIHTIDMPRIAKSKGIILLSGGNLVLTGGTKVFPGDEVRIGERIFEVRPQIKNRAKTMGIVAGAAVLLAVIIAYIGGFIPLSNGQLIGTVMGSSGNRHLPDRVVRLVEKNRSVTTDQAGFFMFDNLESGLYTIQLLDDGEPVSEERIAVIDNEITTFTLYESKPISYTPTETRSPPKALTKQAQVETKIDYGTIKLSISPRNAKAYLDDKPMGTGSKNYNVDPGKYVLSVKRKGYKTKSRNITVKAGKALSYDFALSKSSKGKKKTNGELAYENEIDGNYHEALRYYDKVLAKNSRDLRAIQGKARCFRAQGLIDKAVTYYSQAAAVAAQKGDAATQIEALTAIIEIRPKTMTAYTARGDIYFKQGEYLQAAGDYETVIKLDRRNLGTIYKLGNSYYSAHDFDNAIDAFKAAEELNFADPKAQVYQAKTYLMMGDKKNMKKAYQRCKELSTYAARLEFKGDPDWRKVLAALGVDE